MPTAIRILRNDIADIPGACPEHSPSARDRRDVILAAACRLMAVHGRHAISIASLAGALCLSPGAVKRLFPDMDSLLAEILLRHVGVLANAIAGIAHGEPGCYVNRRAAYLAMTRTASGAPAEAHLLLLRDRHTLPPDALRQIEHCRQALGECLAGKFGHIAMNLLDMPELAPPQIEACLACIAAPAAIQHSRPQRPVAQPPQPARLPIVPPQPNATRAGRASRQIGLAAIAAQASPFLAPHTGRAAITNRAGYAARAGPG
jgi:AcrR family transcriptional regulator